MEENGKIALGVLVLTGAVVFVAANTDNKPDVKAEECTPVALECPTKVDELALKYLKNSGLVAEDFEGNYAQLSVVAKQCGKNLMLPDLGAGSDLDFLWSNCKQVDCKGKAELCAKVDSVAPIQAELPPCAWKAYDAGACTFLDGGDPGVENTYKAELLTGPGCLRKVCIEVAGVSSNPKPVYRSEPPVVPK